MTPQQEYAHWKLEQFQKRERKLKKSANIKIRKIYDDEIEGKRNK